METKPNFIVPLADASAGLSQVGGIDGDKNDYQSIC